MAIYRIRVTGEVLETSNATRRCKVQGKVLTFGREPVYLEADELPKELAADPYLRIDSVESIPPGAEVIDLKAERVQDPQALTAGNDDESDLKAERVQGEEDLKAERVQEPEAVSASPASPNKKRR